MLVITVFCTITVTAEEASVNYGEVLDDYVPSFPEVDNYPVSSISYYDPRLDDGVTPVKSQEGGTCSFFTTISAMEMASYVNTGLKYSYSEETLSWIMSTKLSAINGLVAGYPGYYNRTINDGSNFYYTSTHITSRNNPIIPFNDISWVMPNYLSDVPFTGIQYLNTAGRFPDNINTSYTNAYATETKLIRKDEIKEMILEYGAVYAAVFVDEINGTNKDTGAIYSSGSHSTNHAVTVIGWDDNYSRDNFLNTSKPSTDGAWLIKNSWGTDWGDEGFGWVSYEEASFATGNACGVISDVDKVSKNEYMLSHDFMSPLFEKTLSATNNMVYIANVYDVSELNDVYGSINKVMFYSKAINTVYRVYITPLDDNGNIPPITEIGSSLAYGSVDYEGYRTAELITPYEINSNVDKYAVIIGFGTDEGSVVVSSESINLNPSISSGESFAYYGGTWHDKTGMDSSGNYCIRPTLVRRTSVTQNSQLSLYSTYYKDSEITIGLTLRGNQLYSIWNGNEMLYEDVDFTRNGNSITFKKTFLDSLSTTTYTNIIFEFTDGNDRTLKIYPKALSSVSISGKVAQGQTLSASAICSDSTTPPVSQVTYQWQSSTNGSAWTNISGANSATYTLTANERLKYIRCAVTPKSTSSLICPGSKFSNSTSTQVILYGDADLDGIVNIYDVYSIQKYLANTVTFTEEQIIAADVDGDGSASVVDTVLIQRYLAQIITEFPVEQN